MVAPTRTPVTVPIPPRTIAANRNADSMNWERVGDTGVHRCAFIVPAMPAIERRRARTR